MIGNGVVCNMEILSFVFLFLAILLTYLLFRERELKQQVEKELLVYRTKEGALNESFKNMTYEIYQKSSESFLDLATARLDKWQEKAKGDLTSKEKAIDEMVKPIKETLDRYEKKMSDFSKEWLTQTLGLDNQLKSLKESQLQLKQETLNLSKALRQPHVRGRWGEIQLKRVVEMAGMLEYCDFTTQETSSSSKLRPDMIVKLPNDRVVVVDSKAPVMAYLDALESPTEEKKMENLQTFARHIRTHIQQLSQKSYWDQFSPTPEFVVMFLPGETFFSAALEQDPSLIELGVEQKVLISTPTTLIALLRSVSYGWRQEKMAKSADEISQLGRELYKRINTFSEHLDKVRSSLASAVENFNKCSSSFESRVLVTARKLKEQGVTQEDDIETVKSIDHIPKITVFDK